MSKTGSKEERDLVNKLWNANFAAMRAPASGGATKDHFLMYLQVMENYILL